MLGRMFETKEAQTTISRTISLVILEVSLVAMKTEEKGRLPDLPWEGRWAWISGITLPKERGTISEAIKRGK